jgi:hypothetical protein
VKSSFQPPRTPSFHRTIQLVNSSSNSCTRTHSQFSRAHRSKLCYHLLSSFVHFSLTQTLLQSRRFPNFFATRLQIFEDRNHRFISPKILAFNFVRPKWACLARTNFVGPSQFWLTIF